MAQLLPLNMQYPGAAGLNLQNSQGILPPVFATVAENLVLDKKGRLTLRPGTKDVGARNWTSGSGFYTGHIYTQYRHLKNDGTEGHYMYAYDSGLNVRWIYELTSNVWTARYTVQMYFSVPKFFSFNGLPYMTGYSTGSPYWVYQTSPGTNFTFMPVVSSDAPPLTNIRDVLSAWGRIWVIDDTTLYWCDLLDSSQWGTGGSNQIDLKNVWAHGNDTPIALAEFNGNLVILGKRSLIVYGSPDQVAAGNMVKVEAIDGVGCVARDTVQNIGNDLMWLSAEGPATLGRVIQEKSMPLNMVGGQVADAIRTAINEELIDIPYYQSQATSAYSQKTGTYYLRIVPSYGTNSRDVTWCFHVKQTDGEGHFPVTEIPAKSGADPLPIYSSLINGPTGKVYAVDTSVVNHHQIVELTPTVYLDKVAYTGSGGSAIDQITFTTGWLDFSELDAGDIEKILKECRLIVEGGNSEAITLNVYGDYDDTTVLSTETVTVPATGDVNTLIFNIGGEAGVVKLSFSAATLSSAITLTRAAVYAKRGKLSQ